jgi:hypothetical protein
MGLLKKLTKPLSKFLDKVVPNEIKPALPYLAAFAPFMMGPGAATGGWWQRALYNPATRAGIMGGLNIGSQLSQEGSEGEFSGLSAALAAGQGYLTAGDAANQLAGMKTDMSDFAPERSFLQKARDVGITGAEGASKFLTGAGETIRDPSAWGLNTDTLAAFGTPVTQGTADLAFAEAQRANRDYERQMAADESESLIDDEGRRRAIRAAMEAAGHIEDDILDAIASLGLKEGGRVGAEGGGIMHAKRGFVDGPGGYAGLEEIEDMREFRIANPNIEDVADYKGYYERLKNPQNYDEQGFEIKENVEEVDFGGVKEAVGNIAEENELVASRQSDFFMLREEAIMKNDFDKIKEIEFDFFKEFGIKMPVAQNISEEAPVQMAADGGMMSVLPKGREMDYRGGGVIPMGSKERADDVPARLSKNEFVMTADAVKAAGGGSVNKGAKRMYNLMHKLEARV